MKKKESLMKNKTDKEGLNNIIELDEKTLPEDEGIVLVGTNRWMPDKCMWTAEKKLIKENIAVVFPFPELYASACHVFVGRGASHKCFIHLTPLTSLFRRSTDQLEKIRKNLNNISGEKQNWHFQVYFFADNNNELKLRKVISEVLGKENVNFIAMKPKGYKQGEINLLYQVDRFFYSMQNTKLLMTHRDLSSLGSYNSIPIYAFE
jgi:hypothetical protein